MSGEIPPNGNEVSQEVAQFDEDYIATTFGLTEAEAQQTVTFGEQGSAPFWQVLMDGRCPVGGWVKTAFAEGGREAVEGKLTLFNQMDPEFNVSLGEEAEIKVSFERELAAVLEGAHTTAHEEKTDENEKARVIEKPSERFTTEVTVPVEKIVQEHERATQIIPKKKADLTPTETVVSIEKSKPTSKKLKTKILPEPIPKINRVRTVEQKPVPITSKPEPKHSHIATNPTLVVEQKTEPTLVQMKAETPIFKTLKTAELLYPTPCDEILPELPDIETQEPVATSVYIDGEPLAADIDIFTNLETAFELPDFEQLEIALPFIEFHQPEQTALEGEYSETEEILNVVDQLFQHFETLEPEPAEEASEILSIIMEKIQELESEETGIYRDALGQELETICERMLICMDIEPTPVLVKNLLLVLKIEHQERLGLNPKIAYDAGTHERKNAMLQSAYSLPLEASQKLFHSLGRHTLILAS